jgi:erythronate-4-phosphate dehydrogenase
MKIVVDDKIPFLKGILEPFASVVYREGGKISPKDVSDADALIVRTRTSCDANLLEGSSVRFIATATIGYDHIDTAYCDAHGITWTNAEGCNSSSVQQYFASVLTYLRSSKGIRFADSTIGIVGVGNVGKKVERLSRALGMRVLRNDPPRSRREGHEGFVSLNEIIEQSDIISFHVPLNLSGEDRTLHLADTEFLERLRPAQILINTSRGEVIDTKALVAIIKKKRVSACVLDVWENEPTIDRELLALVDIATPHIAGYSADGKANGTAMSVQAVSKAFGFPLNSWAPTNVPVPDNTVLHEDCLGRDPEDVLSSLIRATYDVTADDKRLRASPDTFEQQRGTYPLRREWPTYTVTLEHATPELTRMVTNIGFKTSTQF